MNKLIPEKSHYEIEKFLGEGITSQVYKAFRVDESGSIRQPVALKIVKSRTHIQILRKEFEKLQKIDSKHCVKVYGWESLKSGPALVLELLEGVNLEVLSAHGLMNNDLITEVLAQIQLGLREIHKSGLVHGDLNLKNIFVTVDGVVKLLDFGVSHDVKDFFGTPQFMAPEVWSQQGYDKASDIFSLGLVGHYLASPNARRVIKALNWKSSLESLYEQSSLLRKDPRKRKFLRIKSCVFTKKTLSNEVKKIIENKKCINKTQISKKRSEPKKTKRERVVFFVLVFLMVLFSKVPTEVSYGFLEVRTNNWFHISVNGLPSVYAPVSKKALRPGKYRLQWGQQKGMMETAIQISPDQTFILKPSSIKL